jgi:hypothetical protein
MVTMMDKFSGSSQVENEDTPVAKRQIDICHL